MANISTMAEYHRTLDGYISKLPYADYEARTEVFRKAGARTAYTIRDKGLVPIMYLEKKDQEFKKYATGWEILHSRIPFGDGNGNVDPVVDENMTVIGHFGVFFGDQIYVPQGKNATENSFGTGNSINALLKRNVDVVAHRYRASASRYIRKGYVEYGVGVSSFAVLTDIEGQVLMKVRSWTVDGVDPSSFSPLDLIAIGKLVFLGLSALTAALVVRTLARRVAAKALSSAVKRELTSGIKQIEKKAEEEFEKDIWSKIITGNPPSVRLGRMGEAGNLWAEVEVANGKVMYRVGSIVLKGEGDAAEIALARAAHREMIKRAAKKAQENGLKQFELRGMNANANFRGHADKLARDIGIPGSGKVLAGTAPGFTSYEVTIEVAKALAGSAKKAALTTVTIR